MRNPLAKTLSALCGIAVLASMPGLANAQVGTEPFDINKSRSRLVILMHGVTPKPEQDPDAKINQTGHSRYYWGFDMVKSLQGRMDESNMRVITPKIGGSMRFKNTVKADWQPTTTDANAFDLNPICFPVSWLTGLPAGIETNQTLIKDHIRLITKNAGANTTMVMINQRDGSKHLMTQLKEFINETYLSYTTAFGHMTADQQPQIYLVTHSFGGIVARGLLANPTEGDLWGVKLTTTERQRADFLRKRVVLVHTLAAPHEGTMIPDVAGDIATYIENYGYSMIMSFFDSVTFNVYKGNPPAVVKQLAKDGVKMALDAVAGKRDCLQDLMRMREYNQGILQPNTARRWAGGPLVPIYTAAGRNPGSTYIDESRSVFLLGGSVFNPVSTIDLIKGTRPSKEAMALYLIGNLMHRDGFGYEGKMPWGIAEHPEGDRVASPFKGIGPNVERHVDALWYPTSPTIKGVISSFLGGSPYKFGQTDGEWDNDGFLGWDSAHAYHVLNQNFFRVFEPNKYGGMLPWDNDNHGSLMFNPGNDAWIHNELIREAGPLVWSNTMRRSVWNSSDVPVNPSTGIKVELVQVTDAQNNMDPTSAADFSVSVRVGALQYSKTLPDDKVTVYNAGTFTINNYAGTLIPIRIAVTERDMFDPNDLCVVSPTPGQTAMYLYYDVRTNRVIGDVNAVGGETFEVKPAWWGVGNKVNLKVRVTRTQ